MSKKFQELKKIYESIYDNTSKISSLIAKGAIDEIQDILDQRGVFIKNAEKIITGTDFSDEEKKEINDFIEKINVIEKNNQNQLEQRRNFVQKAISQINIGHKAISAYKYEKETAPRIIDSKE